MFDDLARMDLARRFGGRGELIDAGQAREAVGRIMTIDRAGCRNRARQRFGADRMANDYLRVYTAILASSRTG